MKQKAAKEFLVGKYGSDPSAMGLAAAQAPFVQSEKKVIGTRSFCWFWLLVLVSNTSQIR